MYIGNVVRILRECDSSPPEMVSSLELLLQYTILYYDGCMIIIISYQPHWHGGNCSQQRLGRVVWRIAVHHRRRLVWRTRSPPNTRLPAGDVSPPTVRGRSLLYLKAYAQTTEIKILYDVTHTTRLVSLWYYYLVITRSPGFRPPARCSWRRPSAKCHGGSAVRNLQSYRDDHHIVWNGYRLLECITYPVWSSVVVPYFWIIVMPKVQKSPDCFYSDCIR